MIKYITSGESHGGQLTGIIKGIPANLRFDEDFINNELKRRQIGYGRSERMKIEDDKIKVLAGVSNGFTTGNPISISIKNRGKNIPINEVTSPRPGHGDLVGALKYNQPGGRNILERASARETAMRVALGAICKLFLKEFNIEIYSHVIKIGGLSMENGYYDGVTVEELKAADNSQFRICKNNSEKKLIDKVKKFQDLGDSLGGDMEVIVKNVPVGLGSHTNWEDKLDAKLAQAIISIQGMKSVEFGIGSGSSSIKGSNFQDEIVYSSNRYKRKTNNAGGIEAGISNGEDIVLKSTMKPIPTVRKGLETVNMKTKKLTTTNYERSDVCAVPSASIVCESAVAYVLANEMMILLGGDFLEETKERYDRYNKYLKGR